MKKLSKPEIRMRHISALATFLNEPIASAKVAFQQLQGIETGGHRLAEQYCNGEIEAEQYEAAIEDYRIKVRRILGADLSKAVLFNGDPRGYFLKISDEYMRANRDVKLETDWGGYGIICPQVEV